MLIAATPRHELHDPVLRAEVSGYFEAAGLQYDVPPTLLVYWAYRESSIRTDRTGKLGEVGLGQYHGVARQRCEDGGYNPATYRGGIYCMAMLMDESRRFCGSLEEGLRRYATGSCNRGVKTIKQRLRTWRRMSQRKE
jgi:hypothetical protein